MDGTTGGRCHGAYATRGHHHALREHLQDDCSARYAVRDGDSAND